MSLSALITHHKGSIVDHWSHKVAERLGLAPSQRPQLVNALPHFLDELAACLDQPPEAWPHGEGAAAHGRHRVEMGLDIGGLAEEFGMVAETILEIAKAEGLAITLDETVALKVLKPTAARVPATLKSFVDELIVPLTGLVSKVDPAHNDAVQAFAQVPAAVPGRGALVGRELTLDPSRTYQPNKRQHPDLEGPGVADVLRHPRVGSSRKSLTCSDAPPGRPRGTGSHACQAHHSNRHEYS